MLWSILCSDPAPLGLEEIKVDFCVNVEIHLPATPETGG